MTKILIATGNIGKFTEMMEVLGDLPFTFIGLHDLDLINDAKETGETYEENAFIKAEHFHKKTGLPTLAEDSGLEVSALAGELGVKTRRWGAGENATDQEWLEYFLNRLEPEEDRTAKFCCYAAFVSDNTSEQGGLPPCPVIRKGFSGESRGVLAKEPLCEIPKGIPVSALFIPEGHTTAFAAMTQEEKNSISHRGEAMHAVKKFLEEEWGRGQK